MAKNPIFHSFPSSSPRSFLSRHHPLRLHPLPQFHLPMVLPKPIFLSLLHPFPLPLPLPRRHHLLRRNLYLVPLHRRRLLLRLLLPHLLRHPCPHQRLLRARRLAIHTSKSNVSSASLDESNNLRLVAADTLLQTQNLTSSQQLIFGSYTFALNASGNLTFRWVQSNNSVLYYNKLALNAFFSSNTSLSTTPTERWAAISDQCEVFGWCWNMGICSYNDTLPVYGCPSLNFMPVDENDSTQGCKRTTELQNYSGNSTML